MVFLFEMESFSCKYQDDSTVVVKLHSRYVFVEDLVIKTKVELKCTDKVLHSCVVCCCSKLCKSEENICSWKLYILLMQGSLFCVKSQDLQNFHDHEKRLNQNINQDIFLDLLPSLEMLEDCPVKETSVPVYHVAEFHQVSKDLWGKNVDSLLIYNDNVFALSKNAHLLFVDVVRCKEPYSLCASYVMDKIGEDLSSSVWKMYFAVHSDNIRVEASSNVMHLSKGLFLSLFDVEQGLENWPVILICPTKGCVLWTHLQISSHASQVEVRKKKLLRNLFQTDSKIVLIRAAAFDNKNDEVESVQISFSNGKSDSNTLIFFCEWGNSFAWIENAKTKVNTAHFSLPGPIEDISTFHDFVLHVSRFTVYMTRLHVSGVDDDGSFSIKTTTRIFYACGSISAVLSQKLIATYKDSETKLYFYENNRMVPLEVSAENAKNSRTVITRDNIGDILHRLKGLNEEYNSLQELDGECNLLLTQLNIAQALRDSLNFSKMRANKFLSIKYSQKKGHTENPNQTCNIQSVIKSSFMYSFSSHWLVQLTVKEQVTGNRHQWSTFCFLTPENGMHSGRDYLFEIPLSFRDSLSAKQIETQMMMIIPEHISQCAIDICMVSLNLGAKKVDVLHISNDSTDSVIESSYNARTTDENAFLFVLNSHRKRKAFFEIKELNVGSISKFPVILKFFLSSYGTDKAELLQEVAKILFENFPSSCVDCFHLQKENPTETAKRFCTCSGVVKVLCSKLQKSICLEASCEDRSTISSLHEALLQRIKSLKNYPGISPNFIQSMDIINQKVEHQSWPSTRLTLNGNINVYMDYIKMRSK